MKKRKSSSFFSRPLTFKMEHAPIILTMVPAVTVKCGIRPIKQKRVEVPVEHSLLKKEVEVRFVSIPS